MIGVDASLVDGTYTAGSTIIQLSAIVPDQATQSAAVSTLKSTLSSTDAASSAFSLTVLTVPDVEAVVIVDDSSNTAVIIGACVGGIAGVMLVAVGAFFMIKRKQSKVEA